MASARDLILLGVLLFGSPGARAGVLLDCWRDALVSDPVLRGAVAGRDLAIEALPQARALLLPAVDARAGWDRTDTRDGAARVRRDGLARGVGVTQTLWSAEDWQLFRAAALESRAAELELDAAGQDLVLRLAEAYVRVLSTAEQLRTARAARDAFGELLRQAGVREETGVGPRSAVVQAQGFYDATLQGVIDARNAMDDALRGLEQITGRYRDSVATLPEDATLPAFEPGALEDWFERLQAGNPELAAARLVTEAARRRVSGERASGLPVLLGGARLERIGYQPPGNGATDVTQVGVTLSLPLFEGGARASRVRMARARSAQAEALEVEVQRAIERDLGRAWRAVRTGPERVAAARRAMESTAAAVEAARDNVEFGTGSAFELLNAQNLHFAARRAWQQSRLDLLLESLRLARRAGEAGEDDLARIDALLTGPGEGVDDVP